MPADPSERFLGDLHDCYHSTDPRVNADLASQLNGLNVIIAGAGRGIGRAAAELFAHGSPASLSLVALEQDEVDSTAELCRAINPSIAVKTAAFNVTSAPAVQDFVTSVHAAFSRVDVLIMNAGRPPQWLPTSEGDPAIWWDTVAVSLQGAYNFSRYCLPLMQRQPGGGRVIFTSSAGAHTNAGISSYIVGKLGMVRLAEIIHAENFTEHGIKAFAIHPGAIPTRFFHDFADAAAGRRTEDLKYVQLGVEGEDKSARTAVGFFEDVTWDTPYLAAGTMTALAAGGLDFMSGRYVDCGMKLEELVQMREEIVRGDLYRVRLNAGEKGMIPRLDF